MYKGISHTRKVTPNGSVMHSKCVSILFFAALHAITFLSPTSSPAIDCWKTSTFSTLRYNKENKSLMGHELKIAFTSKHGLQGVYQFANDTPYNLAVVPIHYDNKELSFILAKYPKPLHFQGIITKKGIEATILWLETGIEEKLFIPRKNSFWNVPMQASHPKSLPCGHE